MTLGEPDPEVTRLLKAATALKKENIEAAINHIQQALDRCAQDGIGNNLSIIQKLADYQSLGGRLDQSLATIQQTYLDLCNSDNFAMKAMYASQLVCYFGTLLRKQRLNSTIFDEVGFEFYCLGLAAQNRFQQKIIDGTLNKSALPQSFDLHALDELKFIDKASKAPEWEVDERGLLPEYMNYIDQYFPDGVVQPLLLEWKRNAELRHRFNELFSKFDRKARQAFLDTTLS